MSVRKIPLLQKIMSWTGLTVLLCLLLLSLTSTASISAGAAESTSFAADSAWQLMTSAAVLAGGLIFLKRSCRLQSFGRRVNTDPRLFRRLAAGLLALTGILAVYWILSVQAQPGADQKTVLKIAGELLAGNTEAFAAGGYAAVYQHQTGIILAVTLLARVLGTGYLPYQLINVPGLLLICWELAETAGLLENRNTVRLSVLLVCVLFFPLGMYVTFVYGTIWSLALALAAMRQELLYFHAQKSGRLAAMGLLIGLAVFLKANSMIFLIAMALAALLESLCRRQAKPLLAAAVCMAALAAEQAAVHLAVSMLAGGERTGASFWSYLAMGTTADNSRAPGWYLKEYGPELYQNYDAGTAAAVSKSAVLANLAAFAADPSALMRFLLEKISSQWNNPTFQGYWIATVHAHADSWLLSDQAAAAGCVYLNGLQSLVLAGAVFYVLLAADEKGAGGQLYLTTLTGGFLFHLFWEAKSQYTLPYFVLLLPLSVLGYSRLAAAPDVLWKAQRRKGTAALCIAAVLLITWMPVQTEVLSIQNSAQTSVKDAPSSRSRSR